MPEEMEILNSDITINNAEADTKEYLPDSEFVEILSYVNTLIESFDLVKAKEMLEEIYSFELSDFQKKNVDSLIAALNSSDIENLREILVTII